MALVGGVALLEQVGGSVSLWNWALRSHNVQATPCTQFSLLLSVDQEAGLSVLSPAPCLSVCHHVRP